MKTKVILIDPQYPDLGKIAYCAKIIRQGGLIIFPTETVYGIAADYSNPQTMQKLREVKKRSAEKPFSVLIAQSGLISNHTFMTNPLSYKLIDRYWPGPLTLVVASKEEGETIGVRMPDHAIALKLVQESQCTIAAPSANFEGNPPPSTCQEALRDLEGLVDTAIDGGPSKLGMGSSVVDLTQEKPVVLREGIIKQADVETIAKQKTVLFVCTGNSCRSVMAEYLLKDTLRNRPDIEIISAGTGVFFRSSASAETISVLQEQGIDATRHLSQALTTIMLKKADLIIVMTRGHREQVLERVPEVEKRVYLLKEFVNMPIGLHIDIDVPDPIGRSHQAYKECSVVIKEGVHKIIELL